MPTLEEIRKRLKEGETLSGLVKKADPVQRYANIAERMSQEAVKSLAEQADIGVVEALGGSVETNGVIAQGVHMETAFTKESNFQTFMEVTGVMPYPPGAYRFEWVVDLGVSNPQGGKTEVEAWIGLNTDVTIARRIDVMSDAGKKFREWRDSRVITLDAFDSVFLNFCRRSSEKPTSKALISNAKLIIRRG